MSLPKIDNCGMARDELERALEQFFARRNFRPGRGAGGMRQRNEIETVLRALSSKFATDDLFQFCAIDELGDGQSADRNDEPRPQDFDFVIHPG